MNAVIRQYRKENGLTQGQLADELTKQFDTRYTTALVSYAESGTVDLPQNVIAYLDSKIAEKPFRNPSDARKDDKWVIMPFSPEKTLKSDFAIKVYDELKKCTKLHPFVSRVYAEKVGTSDVRVRNTIRDIRLAGVRVVSTAKHGGYWLEENGGDYKVMRGELISRAERIFEVVKAMDNGGGDQLTWEEERG